MILLLLGLIYKILSRLCAKTSFLESLLNLDSRIKYFENISVNTGPKQKPIWATISKFNTSDLT